MLDEPDQVIRCLTTYTDWWQPFTTSIITVGSARRDSGRSDGLRAGLVGTLELRAELSRRMLEIREQDRELLFMWYVTQLEAKDIAKFVGISRRQVFRRRAKAIQALVDLAPEEQNVAKDRRS
jgi:DNA-directed RNA polymerase specialized sigma24 family protein